MSEKDSREIFRLAAVKYRYVLGFAGSNWASLSRVGFEDCADFAKRRNSLEIDLRKLIDYLRTAPVSPIEEFIDEKQLSIRDGFAYMTKFWNTSVPDLYAHCDRLIQKRFPGLLLLLNKTTCSQFEMRDTCEALRRGLTPMHALVVRHHLAKLFLNDAEKLLNARVNRNIPKKHCAFISYSHNDRNFVRGFGAELNNGGIDTWIDEGQIRFGDSLIERLREAIDKVDVLLAIISNSSVKSQWVRKELDIAMTREIEQKSLFVIPVVIEPVELPGFLKGKYYADLSNKYRRKKNTVKLIRDIVGLGL